MNIKILTTIFISVISLIVLYLKAFSFGQGSFSKEIFTFSLNPYYGFFIELVGKENYKNYENIILIDSFEHHHFDISPQKIKKVKNSKAVFMTGTLELEKEILKTLDPQKTVIFAKEIDIIENDPHIWVSPKNSLKIIKLMYSYLYSQKIIDNQKLYSNYQRVYKKYEEIAKNLARSFEKVKKSGNFVFCLHNEWKYLAMEYNIKIEPLFYHEEDLSSKHLKNFIKKANQYKNKKFFLILPVNYDQKLVNYLKENVKNVIFITFNSNAVDIYKEFQKLSVTLY